jgi:hypothetical protein
MLRYIWILAGVLAVVSTAIPMVPDALADRGLAQRVLRDIRGMPGVSNWEIVDDDTIRAKVGEAQSQINLDNLRAELRQAARGEEGDIYRRYVAAYRQSLRLAAGADRPVDPDKLLPIVRNSDYLPSDGGTLEGSIGRTIAPGLVVVLAANEHQLIRSVGEKRLAGTGLTLQSAAQRAQANLDRSANGVRIRRVVGSPSLWAAELRQDFGSSLILSERFLKRAVATAGGPIIIGIPERGIMYFAKANDAQAVMRLEGLVRKVHAEALGNTQLSGTIFYSDGGAARVR